MGKDRRQKSVQYLITEADITTYTNEVQVITFTSTTATTISFRGSTTSSIAAGTDTWATLVTELNGLASMYLGSSYTYVFNTDLKAYDGAGNAITDDTLTIGTNDYVEISFANSDLAGSLPLFVLGSSAAGSVARSVPGDAPYRP